MNNFTQAPAENVVGEVKFTPKTKFTKKAYTKTDGIFALIFIALSWFFVTKLVFGLYDTTSLSLFVYIFAYSTTVFCYARINKKKITTESFFWLAFLFVIVLLFKKDTHWQYAYIYETGLQYSNRYYGFMNIVTLRVLVARYFTLTAGNGLIKGCTSSYIIYDLANCMTMVWFNFLSLFGALLQLFKKEDKKEKKISRPVLLGVVIGVIVLAVIAPLLISADATLSRIFGDTLLLIHEKIRLFLAATNSDYFIIESAIYIVGTVLAACYQFAGVYTAFSDEQFGILKMDIAEEVNNHFRFSPSQTINIVMYIVSGVYMAFMALQFGYLFSAFTGKLWGDMTYSEYARQGFFQLCKVSGINIALLTLSDICCKKEEENSTKKSYLLICGLSLLLLATACAKMTMYIAAYGLTCKRFVSCVFLLWLFVVFTLFIAKRLYNVNAIKYIIFIGVILFCGLYIADINKITDNYNIKHGYDKEIKGAYAITVPKEDALSWKIEKMTISHYDEVSNTTDVVEITRRKDINTVIDMFKSRRSDERINVAVPDEYDQLLRLKLTDSNGITYPAQNDEEAYNIYTLDGKYYIAQSYYTIIEISEFEYAYLYGLLYGN